MDANPFRFSLLGGPEGGQGNAIGASNIFYPVNGDRHAWQLQGEERTAQPLILRQGVQHSKSFACFSTLDSDVLKKKCGGAAPYLAGPATATNQKHSEKFNNLIHTGTGTKKFKVTK